MPYLHHVVIHFPVALSLIGALATLIAWFRRDAFWTDAQRRLAYVTALAAIVAIMTGLLSAAHLLEDGAVADAVVLFHRNIALGGTGLAVLTALVAFVGHRQSSAGLALASQLGTLVAAAVIGGAAHFGGDMLHPGMAPWSDKPHSHGVAAPHGHGGAEPDGDHDHDEGNAHAGMPGMAMPGQDSGMPDAGVTTMTTPDAGLDATALGAPDAAAPATAHTHTHGPGGVDAPRPAPTPTSTPSQTATAPAPTPPMTEMPPGHKM